jgi:AcrR family transcriptional regulator
MSEVLPPTRATRADVARNRERLLSAAKAVFNAGGAQASLETVARRAGVGIGTLYRHFPTREALFEAVYRREVDELAAMAERMRSEVSPDEALRRWVRANVEFIATKKGMASALALAAHNKDLSAYSFDRLTRALAELLTRARSAGALRTEIGPQELLRALIGFCVVNDQPDWRVTAMRLIDVFMDGLLLTPSEREGR